ncbi:ABC transporter permease subunit [Alicyclobacillus fastidiosus]|uniref:ABC transporter permease n=1 Tax=Alicyclobacillus fastidiosus TaxID=392011 RepID=A0ABV5AIV2_9BACL|nr:ABC transporter permease [Alicyclobacillus fastidiosus]WEH10153.1 ABC transporter permease [Alicyclobacillus fastidiosus]
MMTIAWMTWTEILRKRVLLVTVLMTLLFLGVYTFAMHSLAGLTSSNTGDDLLSNYLHAALGLAMGLYVSNFTVAYLAIFSSAGTISSEIESGLLLAILPRPVSRWRVYLGKWIGYAVWGVLYGAVMFWAVVVIVHAYTAVPLEAASLWKSFCVFELIPISLVSLSILGSVYLPALGNGVAMTLLFGIGMIGGFIQRITSVPQAAMEKIGLVTSLLIPTNAAYYRMISELMGGSNSPVGGQELSPFAGGPTPSNAFLGYTIAYICVVVGVGLWRFTRKDV